MYGRCPYDVKSGVSYQHPRRDPRGLHVPRAHISTTFKVVLSWVSPAPGNDLLADISRRFFRPS